MVNDGILEKITGMIQETYGTPVELDVYQRRIFLVRWFDVMTPKAPVLINRQIPKAQIDEFCIKVGTRLLKE